MVWLLLLLACPSRTGPAADGSRSALLAERAGDVSRRADLLAAHTKELEGLFDELRAAAPADREAVRQQIATRAVSLQAESKALQEEVVAIEEGARVY